MKEELLPDSEVQADKEREKQIKKELKQLEKKNHPKKRGIKFLIVALLVGIVIGVAAVLWVQGQVQEKAEEANTTVVFNRVVAEDELVVASQRYSVVEKAKDSKKFFDSWDIPFTEKSFWYRYVGTIKAAVDLSNAELVKQDGKTITIALDQPFISSNTPDMNASGVLEENNNLINPISVEMVDSYRKECVEKIEEEAKKGELFEEAKANASADLSSLFSVSLGDEYTVEIEWRDSTAGSQK